MLLSFNRKAKQILAAIEENTGCVEDTIPLKSELAVICQVLTHFANQKL